MNGKASKWHGVFYQIVLWGQGSFLLFGLYSFAVLGLLELPLPRARDIFEALFTTPGLIFATTYFFLWRMFNRAERAPDKKGFANFSLVLSMIALFSFWYSDPIRVADRTSKHLWDSAFDLTSLIKYDDQQPDDWYEAFFWIDAPRDSARAEIVKKLPPERVSRFIDLYSRVKYLRAKTEYLNGLNWPAENREWLSPRDRAKLDEANRASLFVRISVMLVAVASIALLILCRQSENSK